MGEFCMIINLFFYLCLISGLDIGFGSQDLEDDVLSTMVPVLSQIDFGVGTFINFLSDLITLIDHDGLALAGPWLKR